MNKVCDLWVYRLVYKGETVGYRFQVPGTFGCFGEVFEDYQTETFRLVVMFGDTTGKGEHAEKDNKIADWKWLTVDLYCRRVV